MKQIGLIVCGGRNFDDHELFHSAMTDFIARHGRPTWILHGDAPGADRMAGEWAARERVRCSAFPADWKLHGRAAGPRRNREMIGTLLGGDCQGYVLAFPGGRGTENCCQQAGAVGLPVIYVEWER